MRTETVYRVRGAERIALETLAPAQPRPADQAEDGVIVSAYRLYLPEETDLDGLDQVEVRGVLHRVTDFPALRIGHALVVDVEQDHVDLSTFDCVVSIGPAGSTPTFNPTSRRTEVTNVAPAYTGSAAVVLVSTSDGRPVVVADEHLDDRAYLIRLPAGTGDLVEIDHVVVVTAAPNADLVGRHLQVTSVARPGHETFHELTARLFD